MLNKIESHSISYSQPQQTLPTKRNATITFERDTLVSIAILAPISEGWMEKFSRYYHKTKEALSLCWGLSKLFVHVLVGEDSPANPAPPANSNNRSN